MRPVLSSPGTLQHLTETARHATEMLGVVGTCRNATNKTVSALTDTYPEQHITAYEGTVEPNIIDTPYADVAGVSAYHWYVVVDGTVLTDVQNSQSAIVDPTVSQFTPKNREQHDVEVALTPTDELPEIGVFTQGDPEYDWYALP